MNLYISKDFSKNRYDFYLYDETSRGRTYYIPPPPDAFSTSYMMLEVSNDELLSPDERIKPFLSINMRMGEAFINLVAEYAKNEGISIKEQSNNAGKLQAIEQHNQFLQTNLVKLIDFAIAGPGEKIKSV